MPPIDDNEIRKYLAAFADGELDVEQNLRVLEHLKMHPQAVARVTHQHELRKLVDRVLRQDSPPVPAALRQMIQSLSQQTPSSAESEAQAADVVAATQTPVQLKIRQPVATTTEQADTPTILARLRRWTPAIAAALLAAAAVITWQVRRDNPAPVDPPASLVQQPLLRSDLLETRRVVGMGRRHVDCAARIDRLVRAEQFGTEISQVPFKIAQFLHQDDAGLQLDLSSLGYAFAGAGECAAPGARAVHLVYRSIPGSGHDDSISLWVRADAEHKVDVALGKVYAANDPTDPHPILIWRRGNLVYYLVGEAASRMMDTALALQD